jgi:hypothetical protein
MESSQQIQQKEKSFGQRLDFYWQFITAYFIVLTIYSILRGPLVNGTFTVVLHDPVVFLMIIFTLATTLALAVQMYWKRSITVGSDYIIFKSRFREQKYLKSDIIRIAVGREKMIRMRGSVTILKISLKNRRRSLRIRPSSYWNERELVMSVIRLKSDKKQK